jgi:hypothetical protein
MSPEDIFQWVELASGTVKNCIDRVAVAFLSLHNHTIHFSDTNEKEEVKRLLRHTHVQSGATDFYWWDKNPILSVPQIAWRHMV